MLGFILPLALLFFFTPSRTPFVSFSHLVINPERGPASLIKLSTSKSIQLNPLPWNLPPDHHLRPSGVPSFPFPEASDFTQWSSPFPEQCCFLAASFASIKQGGEEVFGSFQLESRCGCPSQDLPRKGMLKGDLRGEAEVAAAGNNHEIPGGSCGLGNITRNPQERTEKECSNDLAGPLLLPPKNGQKLTLFLTSPLIASFPSTFLQSSSRDGSVSINSALATALGC